MHYQIRSIWTRIVFALLASLLGVAVNAEAPSIQYPASAAMGGPGVTGCRGAKNCAAATWGIDLNDNTGFEWAAIDGGTGGSANLFIRVASPAAGTRAMSLWVNGLKVAVIKATFVDSPRPTGKEFGPFPTNLKAGANSIELRDTEGTAELDVHTLRVVASSTSSSSSSSSSTSSSSSSSSSGSESVAASYRASSATGCTGSLNCTVQSWGIDLNEGAGFKWSGVRGGAGGLVNLFATVASASGSRSMSLWVNGVRLRSVTISSTSSPRPTGSEIGPLAVQLVAGSGNTVEFRDTEGTVEFDVLAIRIGIIDADGDKIADAFDACPNTPIGESVNSIGCSQPQLDDDRDGIVNRIDVCPNTPAGEAANSTGCSQPQLDDDKDGVANRADICPNTPAGEAANSTGCSQPQLDDDNDGIVNRADICPNTPTGEAANSTGCSQPQLDDDNDGIVNRSDVCPNTPLGEPANSMGCSQPQLDGDSDGIVNRMDVCPNTPAGETANPTGCSQPQLDDDSDGIVNRTDICSDTPTGEAPNPAGCSQPQLDDDSDGIVNRMDICPNTPTGEAANPTGCSQPQFDDDSDGIVNRTDICSDTPTGEAPNPAGCSQQQLDDDSDGVVNRADVCPDTPTGEASNPTGCSQPQLDDDSDGIVNRTDICSDTPTGEAPNPKGCSQQQLDDDSDGVVNRADVCPDTPNSEIANLSGCSQPQLDDDKDGIVNRTDVCQNTPLGEVANSTGCSQPQLDDDLDLVVNRADICPNTPLDETANPVGCSQPQLDDDGDGVANRIDLCPNTFSNNGLNAGGCSWEQQDEDKDGLVNLKDACMGTGLGAVIDSQGCAAEQRDDDHDGVNNTIDLCNEPASPLSVTAFGCRIGGDQDRDKIPNEFDLCPTVAGLVELRGCPAKFGDFDGDGVTDRLDKCPYSVNASALRPGDAISMSTSQFVADATGCSAYDRFPSPNSTAINGIDACPSVMPWLRFTGERAGSDGCSVGQKMDDDFDGVINGLDACGGEFGPKGSNGCPIDSRDFNDFDRDRIPNDVDHCPETPPIMSVIADVGENGCLMQDYGFEDIDRDGVVNQDDLCPLSPLGHKVNAVGCTSTQEYNRGDSDNDGVMNRWDVCPNSIVDRSHPLTAFGCDVKSGENDRDLDGIPDQLDQCRSQRGMLVNKGCPTVFTALDSELAPSEFADIGDADNDRFPDFDDHCPYTRKPLNGDLGMPLRDKFGPASSGCFEVDLTDDDSDGVTNGVDRCPMSSPSTTTDNEGCNDFERLDSDNDGVINGVDLCPSSFGLWRLNGCGISRSDDDDDFVPDDFDQCPGTLVDLIRPPQLIDNKGCITVPEERDDDRDGVSNRLDRCPNTKFGSQVWAIWQGRTDVAGCSAAQSTDVPDQDSDGVSDFLDRCPGTGAGKIVDVQGCESPFGDFDHDNVPNQSDICPATPRAVALDRDPNRRGCELVPAVSAKSLKLHQLSSQQPGPQEHIIRLADLISVRRPGPDLDLFQLEVTLGRFYGERFVRVFSSPWELRIDVSPEWRNRTLRIPVQIKLVAHNLVTNWFEIIISPSGAITVRSLENVIINDTEVLSQTGITLREVFSRVASKGPQYFGDDPGAQLFRQLWDSQRSSSIFGLPFYCTGKMNGFPIVCDRPETEVALLSESETRAEMDRFHLTAVVNRFDLRKENWQDCGEHRLVFAFNGDVGGRKFFNMEARIANPTPGLIDGCAPTIRFWKEIAGLPSFEKAQRIAEFAMGGPTDLKAIASAENYFSESGQIRTNLFAGGEWLLKEHKLIDTCENGQCAIFARTVSVKENPFGPLFNPWLPFSPSQFSAQAAEFQYVFLNSVVDLVGENFKDLKNTAPDTFNHGQSHSAGSEAEENDYRRAFDGQVNSPFGNNLMESIRDARNADGTTLQVDQLLARATGLTCGGCHNPSQFGLTQPGSIGSLRLPDGRIIDSWPRSFDFVHINERGELSPAMKEVFLPIRQVGFDEVLAEFE